MQLIGETRLDGAAQITVYLPMFVLYEDNRLLFIKGDHALSDKEIW